ncbi:MAG: hypothetical protein ABIF18_03565 [archaeon]
MNKKTLGKVLNKILEEAGENGAALGGKIERHSPNWDMVRRTIATWEKKGKIVCTQKRYPINHGTYVLAKYASGEYDNEIRI